MQGPQADSSILAPALIISESAPFNASILSTCFEPGAMQSETDGAIVLPLRIDATFIISTNDEFVQEPIATWSTLILPISSVVLKNLTKGEEYQLDSSHLSARQRAMLVCGGLLDYTREMNK